MRSVWKWWQQHVIVQDAALAVVLLIFFAGPLSMNNDVGLLWAFPEWVCFLWTIAATIPFVFHRRYPVGAANAFIIIVTLQMLVGPLAVIGDVMGMPVLYTLIVRVPKQRSRRYIALAYLYITIDMLLIAVTWTFGSLFMRKEFGNIALDLTVFNFAVMWVFYAIIVTPTVIAGFWQRARQSTMQMLRLRNAALQESEQEQQRIAAEAERARIARDMHDVVAHTLSTIIIQSDGGRYAAAHDAQLARSVMQTIEHESHDALHAMHDVLQTLSPEPATKANPLDAHPCATPQDVAVPPQAQEQAQTIDKHSVAMAAQHAADATACVNDARSGDTHAIDVILADAMRIDPTMQVDHVVHGSRRSDLDASHTDAIVHVLQESLTNIRRHAGRHARVSIKEDWQPQSLTLTITNDAGTPTSDARPPAALTGHGFGLIGLRERMQALDGTFDATAQPDHGFQVHAQLPLPSAVRRRHVKPRLLSALRSRPIEQANVPHDVHMNRIERFSRWTERHYVLMDTCIAVLLGLIFGEASDTVINPSPFNPPVTPTMQLPMYYLLLTGIVIALSMRRRFPRCSALATAMLMFLQLVVLTPIYLADVVFTLLSVYSVITYGKRGTIAWVIPLCAAGSIAFGLKCGALGAGYHTLWHALIGVRDVPSAGLNLESTILEFTFLSFALCMSEVFAALWSRSKASNTLLLQQREHTLQDMRRKQAVQAANEERSRISAQIQQDVNQVLTSVAAQATAGIRMIDTASAQGATPTSNQITQAFARIGQEGRMALARMRELLGVLRSTASSDTDDATHTQPMALTPAAPLEQQLQHHQKGATA
ncbi:sensor histidine kinase [Bifidobacterium gallicum]|uniref:histidine kinase n=1 Tax=Bifidobacterium gallicum DSM 20093 = LMG 11596 TaxID=561180 RepID=A0A087AEQ3_9BIFI|nr:histidine kinase [Bifidobacterium gallicum]KFI57253.1 putative histidine kinase sensor of two-component system [Bifidobacterium gallicum DSM 20093 = LMG 11596]